MQLVLSKRTQEYFREGDIDSLQFRREIIRRSFLRQPLHVIKVHGETFYIKADMRFHLQIGNRNSYKEAASHAKVRVNIR
jgi:hypothetical protein